MPKTVRRIELAEASEKPAEPLALKGGALRRVF